MMKKREKMKINSKYFVLGGILFSFILLLLFRPWVYPLLQISFSEANLFWSMLTAVSTTGALIAAIYAVFFTFKAWELEKLPAVHAIGTFIISTKVKTNKIRDKFIERPDSPHTLQLVNVGRGPAKNIVPSVGKEEKRQGRFLEEINPHAFSLPSNQGTKVFNETLRIHGLRFASGNDYEIEFDENRKTAYFYIRFEDYVDKLYLTKVTIKRVNQVDDEELDKLIKADDGIEVWKVVDNMNETMTR